MTDISAFLISLLDQFWYLLCSPSGVRMLIIRYQIQKVRHRNLQNSCRYGKVRYQIWKVRCKIWEFRYQIPTYKFQVRLPMYQIYLVFIAPRYRWSIWYLKILAFVQISFLHTQKSFKGFCFVQNRFSHKTKTFKGFCFVWKPISHKIKTFKGFLRVQKANSHKSQVLGFFCVKTYFAQNKNL